MKIRTLAAQAVGIMLLLGAGGRDRTHRRHDERGLSQSAEIAILLAGAVVVATIVVTVITVFVQSKLPK